MVKISKFHFSYQLIYHTHPSVSHTGARRVLYHYLHISRVLMLPLSTPSKNEKKTRLVYGVLNLWDLNIYSNLLVHEIQHGDRWIDRRTYNFIYKKYTCYRVPIYPLN